MAIHRFIAFLFLAAAAGAQVSSGDLRPMLDYRIQTPDLAAFAIRQYLMTRVPPLSVPRSAEAWRAESARLRERVLGEVIFHGWPKAWVDAPLKFEDLGTLPGGKGYRMRKLRLEIVPGFYTTAILYEPGNLAGKVPGVLNVNGHCGAPSGQRPWDNGKAFEYKQKRCINQALRGMLALNLEWIGCGELMLPENVHTFLGHLDVSGTSGVGLFYLAMRKGLDYLWQHPNVDRARVAMTGLSGGGWQTIMLSSLDERVAVSAPVAGYSAFVSKIERFMDIGDNEQHAADLFTIADFTHLTAMRAPRPTLLIYNAEDRCCFTGPMVKPYIYTAVRPFFRLFGKEDVFAWHLNLDPGTHNYQLDNRRQLYRFLTTHLGLPVTDAEIPVDSEVKSYEELKVGLPPDNLTVLGLARKLAAGISRPEYDQATGRSRLREVVRYKPLTVKHAWALHNTMSRGVETIAYRFEMSDGLSAAGLWSKAIAAPENAPITIVVNDEGRRAAEREVAERVNRGEQVIALDPIFTGEGSPSEARASRDDQNWLWGLLMAAAGDRALGIEAAQIAAVTGWLRERTGNPRARLDATGMRSQVQALVASAMAPGLIAEIEVRGGIRTLGVLLEKPVAYQAAPDLFCRDLYRAFDIDRLEKLAAPVKRSEP